ncbi:MAG: hypothetical protein ACJAXQ_001022 [Parvibaculaceae bacterium]|jgi:hypothetical protein|tara:strand:+ start:443 stop:604 length:162 start_codon:yes stop_codon:yes gene_type:complete
MHHVGSLDYHASKRQLIGWDANQFYFPVNGTLSLPLHVFIERQPSLNRNQRSA